MSLLLNTSFEIHACTGPPFIITPPANTSVPDGGSFTLSCIAIGYPRPNIQWQFDDVLSDGVSEDIINDFEIRSNLTVYNYTESMNEGEYYCEASNQYYDPVSSVATVATKYRKYSTEGYYRMLYFFLSCSFNCYIIYY